jgi:chromosome segregation ATPase
VHHGEKRRLRYGQMRRRYISPAAAKPRLNQALQHYRMLTEQVKAPSNGTQNTNITKSIAGFAAQRTSTQRDLTKLDHEQQQLANLRNQWPVYQQLKQLQATNMTTTLTTATRTRYQQLSQQRTDLQHALASARQQLSQQPVDTQSQGLVGFYVQHQDQFDQLEAQLPTLQQTLGQYQTLTQQGSAAKADFQAQSNAHPELLGCLSPHKQAAIETLKATLAATANTRRQHPAPNSPSLDWHLIGGAIGIVAGLLLPLGGFKWILMLAGVALLGWFGMTRSQGKPVQATDHLSDQLVGCWSGTESDCQ